MFHYLSNLYNVSYLIFFSIDIPSIFIISYRIGLFTQPPNKKNPVVRVNNRICERDKSLLHAAYHCTGSEYRGDGRSHGNNHLQDGFQSACLHAFTVLVLDISCCLVAIRVISCLLGLLNLLLGKLRENQAAILGQLVGRELTRGLG